MAKAKQTKTIDMANTLQSLSKSAQRNILASLIGGLNMSIIATVKRTLPRQNEDQDVDGMTHTSTTKGIDAFNERIAELTLARIEAEQAGGNGHEVKNPLEDLSKLLALRGALADQYVTTTGQEALSVASSLDFLLDLDKNPIKRPSDEVLAKMAKELELSTEHMQLLKEEAVRQATAAHEELFRRSGEIIDATQSLERDTDVISIDRAFDRLNISQKARMCARICKSITKQIDRAVIQMLRGSIIAISADIKLMKAAHNEVAAFMNSLDTSDDPYAPDVPCAI